MAILNVSAISIIDETKFSSQNKNRNMSVRGPTKDEELKMVSAFTEELESSIFVDAQNMSHPIICSVCDTIAHVDVNHKWMKVTRLRELCLQLNMTKEKIKDIYPAALIAQYTVPRVEELKEFVLSPKSVYNSHNETIAICTPCANHMRVQVDKFGPRRVPPNEAIISAYLIGDAPKILMDLNDCEIALLSTVRTNCQSWIYFAGCHKHIQGWHTFYENRPGYNVATIDNLADAGLKGQLLVVLCGPFTSSQKAKTYAQTRVRPEKVIKAFQWLKINNYHYRDIVIPREEDLPIPQIIEENT